MSSQTKEQPQPAQPPPQTPSQTPTSNDADDESKTAREAKANASQKSVAKKRSGKGIMEMILAMSSIRYKGKYFDYKFNDVMRVLRDVKEIFIKEKPLVECPPPVVIVGDLHGQYTDLLRTFSMFNGPPPARKPGFLTQRYVFLGDYVDRGKQSLETVMLLFLLKIKFPRTFLLLRGNHETKAINRVYGFCAELGERFVKGNEGTLLFDAFNDVFNYMPVACLVGNTILCMHGGISPKLQSLDDIRNLPKPIEDPNKVEIACDLLWADPMINLKGSIPNKVRGVSVHFGEDVLVDVMKRLNLMMIVRGHQMMMNGFNCFAHNKLVTVFTAASYYPDRQNNGAVMYVTREHRIGFKILAPVVDKDAQKVFRGAHDEANKYDIGYAVFNDDRSRRK